MAVTLTATARLNTGPYTAGLNRIASATAALNGKQVSGASRVLSATEKQIQANERQGRLLVSQGRAQEMASRKAAMAQDKMAASTSNLAQGLSSQRYLFHDLSRQMAQYTVGLAAPFAATVGVAAQWENAFSAVERTADPVFASSTRKVEALRASLVDMVQAMPVSFTEATEIATLANQMGIASEQVANFTRATAMFAATSGVTVEQSATAFGRLTSIMGDNAIGFNQMADSILKVGVNSVATEGEIINVTTQISSIAAQAGFSTEEMIGLSGALASVRVPPELSRGLVTRVFGQMDKAVSQGGANLATFARLSGRSMEEFRKDWGSDQAGKLFTDFVMGLKKAGPAAMAELESVGINSVRDKPVLVRLANAAGSDGKSGSLLTQTMEDAQNAAGETQRQYSIMADTVWNKMKVLGNNVLAMFDEIGRSNLGGFGTLLDNMSSGIRSFTDSLDDPIKILGGLELPWTNAEGLGFVTNLSLMAAGLTGVAAIALKIGAGVTGLKQMANVMTGGKIAGFMMGSAAGSRGGMAAEIAASTAAAAASRPALAAMRSGAVAAGTAWANMGRSMAYAARSAADPRLLTSGRAFEGVIQTAPAAQGALGNLVRFGLHPATVAIGAASAAALVLADQFFEPGTEAKHFAENLASIDTSQIKNVSKAFSQLEVGGAESFWKGLGQMNFKEVFNPQKSITPFANGMTDFRNQLAELTAWRKHTGDGIFSDLLFDKGADLNSMIGTGTSFRPTIQGIETLGKSIQGLVDAGNSGAAVNTLKSLTTSGEALKTAMKVSPEIDSLVKSMFATSDIEMTDKALSKLAKGALPEVTDAYLGLAGVTRTSELFEDDMNSAAEFQKTLDTAASAFVDFGKSMESATTTDENGFLAFDLGGFGKSLAQSVEMQQVWQDDMTTIAKNTTTGVVKELAALGPAAAPQVAAIADALRSKNPEMRKAGEDLIAQMEAGAEAKLSVFGGTLGEIMANQSWLNNAMDGNTKLVDIIADRFSGEDLTALRQAGQNASQEVIQGVIAGLGDGQVSMTQALEALESNIPIDTYIRENQAASELRSILEKQYKVDIPVDFNMGSTVGQLQTLINDPALKKMDIDADLSLTEAYAKIPEFQSWADALGIKIPVDANTSNADAKVSALDSKASAPKTKNVDANTGPATGQVIGLDGKITAPKTKPVNANTSAGLGKITTMDNLAKTGMTKPVDADVSAARSEILSLNGLNTSSNHTVNVTQNIMRHVQEVVDMTTSLGKEDGGLVSFYANGGIRTGENHLAQIAPAGTMRVWAEPETGGEAYIPLARHKRTRSLAILDQVASRFGYSLTQGADAARYANGGTYSAQQMSRATSSVRGGFADGGLSVSDRQFFAHLFRTVVVTADSQAITGLTNDINTTNARFGR